jgi:hypothetical protein
MFIFMYYIKLSKFVKTPLILLMYNNADYKSVIHSRKIINVKIF